jgi:hypothetical protein
MNMNVKRRIVCLVVGFLSLVLSLAAQTSGSSPASAQVPPLIPFSNIATDEGGNSMSGVVRITFSLYNGQQGGEPLWSETQNDVQLDATGHYSVQLGITKPNGMPTTLFTTGEARWLGVRIAEQGEQPRVLLLSVPYALKAGDAATVGGLPPSAFVLAAPPLNAATSTPLDASATPQSSAPPPAGAVTGTGKVNFVPLWDSTSDITSSVISQYSAGTQTKVSINANLLNVAGIVRGFELELSPLSNATASAGTDSGPLVLQALSYNSGTSRAVPQTFQWQAEPAANNTSNPSGTLNLLFGSGNSKPTETGLNIASTGLITFAPGQTFPGTGDGTITGIATALGSGLTGGGTSGALTLGLLNNCATGQVLPWSGTAWTCSTVSGGGGGISGSGTANYLPLFNSGSSVINSKVFQSTTGVTNGYIGIGTPTPGAALDVNGAVNAATSFNIGGIPFAFGVASFPSNSFVGFAGNSNPANTGIFNFAAGNLALSSYSTGSFNTAVGKGADGQITTGSDNTAVGENALENNISGNGNTAVGGVAGFYTAGSNNTALGDDAGPDYSTFSTPLNNSTAIGARADVTVSNALVLGSILNVNNCTTTNNCASVNVGIGTTAPAYPLDVNGIIRSSAGGFQFPDGSVQTKAATGGGGGSGTVTSVATSTGLLGGPITTSGTLSIDPTVVPLLATSNTFAGAITASSFTGSGALLTNVNAATLGGFPSTTFATTGSNTFTGNQTINGNLALPHTNSSGTQGVISFGGVPFVYDYGVSGSYNAFFGFNAGNLTNTGLYLTAVGDYALSGNSSGSENTAVGDLALSGNLSGLENTAVGVSAGVANTIGSSNTFLGTYANSGSASLNNSTAIGAYADVTVSNALVLGGILNTNYCTTANNCASVNVGIGTTAPAFPLDVAGIIRSSAGGFQFPDGSVQTKAATGGGGGSGTVTSVGSGAGLTGGPITTSGTLSIDPTVVPLLATSNTFAGSITASSFTGSGALLTNVNAATLGGFPSTTFATTGSNTFTGNQTVNGSIIATGLMPAGNTITVNGFNATSGSGQSGGQGIYVQGGSGDPAAGSDSAGGIGGMFQGAYGVAYGGDGLEAYAGGVGAGGIGAYAGYFSGDLHVTGAITAGTKDFKIDHPLDPANKYLFHASVESSEMMNIYTGNVTTDAQGDARVELPGWFEAVNTDFRYQLTVIGQFAQAIVSGEVANHRFSIKTDKPNVKVSWQITGVRQDAYAKAHPLVVELEKDARERGHYIHPELYGASEQQSVDWARHPEMMKRMRETRARQLSASQK